MIPILPNEERDFVLRRDRIPSGEATPADANPPTVFRLRSLSFRTRCLMEDDQGRINAKTGDMQLALGSTKRKTLQVALAGWKHLYHPRTGQPIPFETAGSKINVWGVNVDPPAETCLDILPPDVVTELCNAIHEGQHLTDDEGNG
jgi:hypothetical protein